jgi:hypothetical protein
MLCLPKMRSRLALPLLLAGLMPVGLAAQQSSSASGNHELASDAKQFSTAYPSADANEYSDDTPLGDVARNLRKKAPPTSPGVIDDDNLSQVMSQAESRHDSGSALKYMMAGEAKDFRVSAPDVTCSLAFSAGAKSLLSTQYGQMVLPAGEVLKLEGPATIEGDALLVSVHNRTDWHVSEVTVALTVVKRSAGREGSLPISGMENEVRPEKDRDAIVIYKMRAAAPPDVTTVFSAPLNLELAADEEWHWAIVQARGYPPESYAASTPTTMQAGTPSTAGPALSASPESVSTASLPERPE